MSVFIRSLVLDLYTLICFFGTFLAMCLDVKSLLAIIVGFDFEVLNIC